MISKPLGRIVAIVTLVVISTATVGAWPHKHGQKARVRFLATSTLIRGTFGQNEDTYLANLSLGKGGERVLVRLVDAYPNEAPPLSREVLMSDSGTVLLVKRDSQCDRPFGETLLRAAPGDPIALFPGWLDYQPPLTRGRAPYEILPCYRVAQQP